MSARVLKGLIGVRSARGIQWYRSRSVRMAIEVSRKKKADTSPGTGRCLLESGRASLESTRVRKGLIGIRSLRGIDWHRSRSVHMPIEISRKQKADTLPGTGRCLLESGRASLEFTRLGVMNSVNLDGRACPSPKVDNIPYFY